MKYAGPAIILLLFNTLPHVAQARPVSYADGWTLIQSNDAMRNLAAVHYSPTARYSYGVKHTAIREDERSLTTLTLNHLLKRWNMPDAQANLYLKTGAGMAENDGKMHPAAEIGLAADYETRRIFTSYQNHFVNAGPVETHAMQRARVGIAPYIGDYDDLHTWLMLEVYHHPGEEDDLDITPLVRLFKGQYLLEAGSSLDGDVLFNFAMRF